MILIIFIVFANIIVFLHLKFLRRFPALEALFYSTSVWPLAIIIIYLSRHDAGFLSTRLGILILSVIVGLLILYVGERLFHDRKDADLVSGGINKGRYIRRLLETFGRYKANQTDSKLADNHKPSTGDYHTVIHEDESIDSGEGVTEIHEDESIGSDDDATETYEFEWTFLSDAQRQQIASYVRANACDSWAKQNVNLLYGVVDQQRTFMLTLIYFLSDGIMRTDTGFDYYRFAFIINGELMTASCEIRGLTMKNYSINRTKPYYHLVKQAIEFYYADSTSELKSQFEQQYPNTGFYKYMNTLRKELLTNFIVETLGYDDEANVQHIQLLTNFCQVMNTSGGDWIFGKKYTVEQFKQVSKYAITSTRLINREGDVWLYFMGCTDRTHAPAGFMESEWLLFYYRGVAARLYFEERVTHRRFFQLNYVQLGHEKAGSLMEYKALIKSKGVPADNYFIQLRDALGTLQAYHYVL